MLYEFLLCFLNINLTINHVFLHMYDSSVHVYIYIIYIDVFSPWDISRDIFFPQANMPLHQESQTPHPPEDADLPRRGEKNGKIGVFYPKRSRWLTRL